MDKNAVLAADKLVLTSREAGLILRIGRNRLNEMLKSGRLRSVKNGKRYLIPRAAIDEFLALDGAK